MKLTTIYLIIFATQLKKINIIEHHSLALWNNPIIANLDSLKSDEWWRSGNDFVPLLGFFASNWSDLLLICIKDLISIPKKSNPKKTRAQ